MADVNHMHTLARGGVGSDRQYLQDRRNPVDNGRPWFSFSRLLIGSGALLAVAYGALSACCIAQQLDVFMRHTTPGQRGAAGARLGRGARVGILHLGEREAACFALPFSTCRSPRRSIT